MTSSSTFLVATVPVITSIAPSLIDATRPPSVLQIVGANLTGASFAFLPLLQPVPIATGSPIVNTGGTAAALPIIVMPTGRGRFTLVGTNSAGSSDAFPSNGNALWMIGTQDDLDTDGDGFPDGLERLFGSDPFDPASRPDLTVMGDVQSSAVTLVNTGALPTSQEEVRSSAFTVSNTLLKPASPLQLMSPAFSVGNTLLSSPGQQL